MKTIAILLALATSCTAQDWPQFLGQKRDGTSEEAVRSTFDPEPEITWKHKVGTGLAGPAVAGGMCVIFHRAGDIATVDALDARTGRPIWKFTYETDYIDNFGFDPGPRATPTIAGDRVYTYGAEGVLHCLSLKDGTKVWSVDTTEDPGSANGFFGRACAPLVHEDTLIIQLDSIVALDVEDGSMKWTSVGHEAGYSSPTLTNIGDHTYSVHLTREGFVCIDIATGKLHVNEPFRSKINASVNAATPIMISRNRAFLSSCYDVGAALWEFDPAKNTNQKIWARENVLDVHYATPVQVGDHLYGFHGRQETGQELRCIDPVKGKVVWKKPFTTGSVIAAEKQLVILTEKGELVIAPASPNGFEPTARGQILGATTRAIPALADGRLYARDGKNLVCIDLAPAP